MTSHAARHGGPGGGHRGRGKGPQGIFLWTQLGGLSSQGTERWHQVWLGSPNTRRPPHLSTVPEGGARAACGLSGVTFPGSSVRGRGTGCVRHLSLLTRPPRGATAWGLGGQAKAGSHRLPRQSHGRIRAAGGGASCLTGLPKLHLPGKGLETFWP